jgi:integrase/recombinase XerD
VKFLNIVDEFKEWLSEDKKLSSGTLGVYLVSVRNFLQYYEKHHSGDFIKLEKEVVNGYVLKMVYEEIPAATINSKMTGLKKFNRFLVEKGYQEDIVIERNHRVEYDSTSGEKEDFLSSFEVEKFLAAVRMSHNKRDLALVFLIMKTDLTIPEIVDLRLSNYQNRVIAFTSKNNERKNYHVDNELGVILDDYIHERKNKHYSESKYLFISNKSGRLDKRHIFHLFNAYSQQAMLFPPITPGRLSGFDAVHVEQVNQKFEYKVDKEIKMDITIVQVNFHESMAKIEVIINYKGNQRTFLFSAVKPGDFHLLLKGMKGFYPKGIFITPSFNKKDIKKIVLDSFYIDEKSQIQFLNQLEAHSLSEDEINNLEERL